MRWIAALASSLIVVLSVSAAAATIRQLSSAGDNLCRRPSPPSGTPIRRVPTRFSASPAD